MAKAAKKPEAAGTVPKSAGKSPNLKGGSRKGVPNKLTSDVRAMILTALHDAGGAKYLQKQANDNPAAFMTLVGKTLPKEITGPDGKPIFPTSIKIELVSAK
jgi:hypothetical protein